AKHKSAKGKDHIQRPHYLNVIQSRILGALLLSSPALAAFLGYVALFFAFVAHDRSSTLFHRIELHGCYTIIVSLSAMVAFLAQYAHCVVLGSSYFICFF